MSEAPLVGFPLSPQQHRLWRLAERAGSDAFAARCALRLRGPLDAAALRAALERVVARHEILRTRFERLPGMSVPVQVPLAADDPAASAVSVDLVRLAPDDHRLILALPALCADAGTLENLIGELAAAYAAGPQAEDAEELTYAQFAEWQNDLLEGEDGADGRSFWAAQKLGEVAPLRLPVGLDGAAPAFAPATLAVELPAELAGRVAAAAAAAGVTPETYLLAAWLVLLGRLTGREDLVVGRLAGGRDHELLRPAFGLFAHTLPVRVDVVAHLPWSEIMRRVAAWLEATEEWQESFTTGDALPDATHHFAAGFAWREKATVDREAAGVRFEVERLDACVDRCDLLLAIESAGAEGAPILSLELRYDAGRLAAADVAGLGSCLAPLLASAVARPEGPVAELDLLSVDERRRLEHPRRRPAPATLAVAVPLHRLFEAQAERTPERLAVAVALVEEAAPGQAPGLTFGELDARANQLARHLRGLGVGPDVPVGLLLPRSPDLLVALWAVLKAGGACMPLDLAYPPARLASLLAESRAPLVLTASAASSAADRTALGVPTLDLQTAAAEIAAHASGNLGADDRSGAGNLAYVIHTSGTTGQPKGVMVEHHSVVHLANALAATVYAPHAGRPLRVSLNAPLAFDSSVKQWVQQLFGHTLQLVPEEVRLDGVRYVELLRRHRVDVLDCTPSQLRLLLAAGLGDGSHHDPCAVLVGGEAIDVALWRRLGELEATGPSRFYNVYGPTECTVDATARARAGAGMRPTLGAALPGVETWVLDSLRLPDPLPVPNGFAGELWIGGEGVARGYRGRPDLTADRFRPAPFPGEAAGARVYRSGDLVRRLAGDELEFLGRADRQVKVRGLRVELEEIERTLAAHPAVRQAAVVLVPPVATATGTEAMADGADGVQLAAYLGLRGAAEPGLAGELRVWLRERLPEPMVPAFFVPLPDLPLTASGKVDRRALPDARQAIQARSPAAHVEPRSEAERNIAAIWQEVLGVPVVGVDDNFFDLGGHSLLMVRAHGRLQEAFGRPIPMVELFRFPTVGSLAIHLTGDAALTLGAVRDRAARQHGEQERQRAAQQRARQRLAPATGAPAAPPRDEEGTR